MSERQMCRTCFCLGYDLVPVNGEWSCMEHLNGRDAAAEIVRLNEQLAERTLQHQVQLDNAVDLTARLAAAEAHEQKTHERLGAILGTDTSLEEAAKRMAERLAAAEARNECPLCGLTPGAISTCFCEECVGELQVKLAAAEAERDELEETNRNNVGAYMYQVDDLEQRLAERTLQHQTQLDNAVRLTAENESLTARLAAAEAAARFYAKWYDGPAEALLGEEDRRAFMWIEENGGVT